MRNLAIIITLAAWMLIAATGQTTCRCGCKSGDITPAMQQVVKALEAATGRQATITSGRRCEPHNKAVGGVKGSRHTTGKAVDLAVKGMTPGQVAAVARKIKGVRWVGVYNGHVHVDVH